MHWLQLFFFELSSWWIVLSPFITRIPRVDWYAYHMELEWAIIWLEKLSKAEPANFNSVQNSCNFPAYLIFLFNWHEGCD